MCILSGTLDADAVTHRSPHDSFASGTPDCFLLNLNIGIMAFVVAVSQELCGKKATDWQQEEDKSIIYFLCHSVSIHVKVM